MSNDKMREEFEAWITSPPYEKPVAINQESSGFPGQYRAYEVQLAWEAWQASRAALVVELPALPPQGATPYAERKAASDMHAKFRLAITSAGARVKP